MKGKYENESRENWLQIQLQVVTKAKKLSDHDMVEQVAKVGSGKVKGRIKEKLVTSSVTTCDQKLSDEEIIEQAAEVGSDCSIPGTLFLTCRHQRYSLAWDFLREELRRLFRESFLPGWVQATTGREFHFFL